MTISFVRLVNEESILVCAIDFKKALSYFINTIFLLALQIVTQTGQVGVKCLSFRHLLCTTNLFFFESVNSAYIKKQITKERNQCIATFSMNTVLHSTDAVLFSYFGFYFPFTCMLVISFKHDLHSKQIVPHLQTHFGWVVFSLFTHLVDL